MTLSRKQTALVHVAKKRLGLEDANHRTILQRFGGAGSAAELGLEGFENVMRRMSALGFKSTWTKRTFGERPGMASPSQVDLIRKLWADFNGADADDSALNAWLDHFHHVSAVRFIDAEKAAKVIPALKAMAGRASKSNLRGIQSP